MVANFLFRLARGRMIDPMVRWSFAHLSSVLPVRRVASTSTVLAFHHPRPWREHHLLLVPKTGIASFMALDPSREPLVTDVLILAESLAASLSPNAGGPIGLVVNGGADQEVGQLHFHLVAGPGVPSYSCPETMQTATLLAASEIVVFDHPNPTRETHLVLRLGSSPLSRTTQDPIAAAQVLSLIAATQALVRRFGLIRRGFSLIAGGMNTGLDYSCFHLVSGQSLRNERPFGQDR